MPGSFLYSRILIVDDEVEVCESLKQYLTNEQFTIETAVDGEDAIAKLDDFKPDVILLDILMPNLNGKEGLTMIKHRLPDVEIIMVSAITNIKTVEECMQNGAFGYIAKPVDLNHLIKNIHKALEKRQNRLANRKLKKRKADKNKD